MGLTVFHQGDPRGPSLFLCEKKDANQAGYTKGVTESQLCAFGGWRIGSSAVQRYVKLSGKTLLPTLMDLSKKPVECPFCQTKNNASLRFCEKCMKPLNAEEAKLIMRRDDADRAMNEMFKDKHFQAMVAEYIRRTK